MRIVCIGGGTGLSQLLSALKGINKIKRLSAIVTVTDSGGSTGILRKIYDIPAIGDIRNCLLTLSEIDNYIKKAFQYRFKGEGLSNHPLGNLFLVSLIETQGNFEKAIKIASKILKIKGEVIPSTLKNVHLGAIFEDNKKIIGEDLIPQYKIYSKKSIKKLFIYPSTPLASKLAIQRIITANIIFIGPGSLYTSILPNFLVKGISRAVNISKAKKVFIMNLLTQPGETDDFTASDHLREFFRISKIKKLDYLILNKSKITPKFLKKMKQEGKKLVNIDEDRILNMNVGKIIIEDLAIKKDTFLKHDPSKLKKLFKKWFIK